MQFQPCFEILYRCSPIFPSVSFVRLVEPGTASTKRPYSGERFRITAFCCSCRHESFFQNERGLSEVYNIAIMESEKDPANLVFIHDDVRISDFYWPGHVHNTLKHFGIVSVAG